jgi:hypothetical protein
LDATIDPSRPFAFPFIVENKSWLFDMRNTNLACDVDDLRFAAGGGLSRIRLVDEHWISIAPGDQGLFKCSIGLNTEEAPGSKIVKGHIFVSVFYQTLNYFGRQSPSTEFTWYPDGNPPHWVKGASPR